MRKVHGVWFDECGEVVPNKAEWNMYSIHDVKEVARRLSLQHEMKKAVALKAGLPVPTDRDLQRAIYQNANRYSKFRGDQGKYVPHQGARECERRRGQYVNR